MQILSPTSAGQVVAIEGHAVARGPGGRLRMLSLGDWVAADEVIVAGRNGSVQLATEAQPAVQLAALGPAAMLAAARSGRGSGSGGGSGGRVLPDLAPTADAPPAGESSGPLGAGLRVEALADPSAPGAVAVAGLPAAAAPVASPRVDAGPGAAGDRLAPWAAPGHHVGTEDVPLALPLQGHAGHGRIDQVWIVKVPTGGVLFQADGMPVGDLTALTPAAAAGLVFRPAPDFHGDPGPLQYRVVDARGQASPLQTITIELAEVNDAPRPGTLPSGPDNVAVDDPSPYRLPGTGDYHHDTPAGMPVAGLIAATDVDGDRLRFGLEEAPRHGDLSLDADGAFVYTPADGFAGTDRFVVTIDDGRGGLATSTVTVGVAAAAPDAGGQAVVADDAFGDTTLAAPLPTGEVFAWHLAEPAEAPVVLSSLSAEGAAPLDLRDLLPSEGWIVLPGEAPGAPSFVDGPGDAAGLPVLDPGLVLDLGLDWGLRQHWPAGATAEA